MEKSDAYDLVVRRLDQAFQYDSMTDPHDFGNFLARLQRKPSQTLQEYQQEFQRTERRLSTTHQVKLPENLLAWWYLRRSGLARDQPQLVLTQLGDANLTLDKTMKAMKLIMGKTLMETPVEGGTLAATKTARITPMNRMNRSQRLIGATTKTTG